MTRCTRPRRRARRRPARDIRSCRIGRAPDQAGQASRSRAVRSPHRRACRRRRPSGQPHRTGLAAGIGLRPWDDITLGDGEGQGERAPSRRSARVGGLEFAGCSASRWNIRCGWGCSAGAGGWMASAWATCSWTPATSTTMPVPLPSWYWPPGHRHRRQARVRRPGRRSGRVRGRLGRVLAGLGRRGLACRCWSSAAGGRADRRRRDHPAPACCASSVIGDGNRDRPRPWAKGNSRMFAGADQGEREVDRCVLPSASSVTLDSQVQHQRGHG